MALFGGPILEVEGQIIEGTSGSLRNMGCRVNVSIDKLKFNDVRLVLSFEDKNLDNVIKYERLRGKVIEIVVK